MAAPADTSGSSSGSGDGVGDRHRQMQERFRAQQVCGPSILLHVLLHYAPIFAVVVRPLIPTHTHLPTPSTTTDRRPACRRGRRRARSRRRSRTPRNLRGSSGRSSAPRTTVCWVGRLGCGGSGPSVGFGVWVGGCLLIVVVLGRIHCAYRRGDPRAGRGRAAAPGQRGGRRRCRCRWERGGEGAGGAGQAGRAGPFFLCFCFSFLLLWVCGRGGPKPRQPTHTHPTTTPQIDALEQCTAAAAPFLPPYDVRRAQEEAQGLRGKLEATRAALAPRKKFSFAARRRNREQQQQGGVGDGGDGGGSPAAAVVEVEAAAAPPPPPPSSALAALSLAPPPPPAAAQSAAPAPAPASAPTAAAAPAMEGFEGREGEALDLTAAYGADPPRDLLLKDLRRCTVRL